MDVTCRLTGIEAIADPSWEDTYIDIVFQEYDAFVFQWESVTVSKDTQTPLAGYEEQLIRSVGRLRKITGCFGRIGPGNLIPIRMESSAGMPGPMSKER